MKAWTPATNASMWGKLQPSDDGEARVRELMQTGKFWGGMIGRGADHERYDGTREDAVRIVRMILDNAPCKLHIHEEHDHGERLAGTAAGQEVTDGPDILKAQHTGIQQGTFNELTKDVYQYRQKCVEDNEEFIDQRSEVFTRHWQWGKPKEGGLRNSRWLSGAQSLHICLHIVTPSTDQPGYWT